jgi:hypothetical protein
MGSSNFTNGGFRVNPLSKSAVIPGIAGKYMNIGQQTTRTFTITDGMVIKMARSLNKSYWLHSKKKLHVGRSAEISMKINMNC